MDQSTNPLVLAAHALRMAVTAECNSPGGAFRRVEEALAAVEGALRQHADEVGHVNEDVLDLDRPLLPSPGADRRHGELRDELANLLWETRTLRKELQNHPRSPVLAPDAVCNQGAAPAVATPVQSQRGRFIALADALEHYTRDETDFVQETVTTDIGAGD